MGLGKTIESVYIWNELQARHDARRLLIVCPAMLCEKWKDDLAIRFNITAEIVNPKKLLSNFDNVLKRGITESYISIISLEDLRGYID